MSCEQQLRELSAEAQQTEQPDAGVIDFAGTALKQVGHGLLGAVKIAALPIVLVGKLFS